MSAVASAAAGRNDDGLRMLAMVLIFHQRNMGSWVWLSSNKNITMEIVSTYPKLPWDYNALSRNPNLTVDFIRKNPRKRFSWQHISANRAMTPEIVEANRDLPWDFHFMSVNPSITLEYVRAHPHRDWNMQWVASNRGITPHPSLDFQAMSRNPNVTEEFIEEHIDANWDWGFLSSKKNVSLEFIEAHMDKPWDWYVRLSQNPNMTMDFVKRHRARFVIDLPYIVPRLSGLLNEEGDDFNEDGLVVISYGLGANPVVTPELLVKHIDKEWNWGDLSRNLSIPLSFIEEHPELPWNWMLISDREDITPGFILRNLDKNWLWRIVDEDFAEEVEEKMWELEDVRTIGWEGGVWIGSDFISGGR
jgi:uncharacterized protein with HEPN domain